MASKSYTFTYEMTEKSQTCMLKVGNLTIEFKLDGTSLLTTLLQDFCSRGQAGVSLLARRFRQGCSVRVLVFELEVDIDDKEFVMFASGMCLCLQDLNNHAQHLLDACLAFSENRM